MSRAWECLNGYDLRVPVEEHIVLASDILFGRVVQGTYDTSPGSGGELRFTLQIHERFKGDLEGSVELRTSHYSYFYDVALGGNYIVFL